MASQHNSDINTDLTAFVHGESNNNNKIIAHEQGEPRDERTASSSTREHPLDTHQQFDQPGEYQEIPVSANADPTIVALFSVINETKYLISKQNDRIRVLEKFRLSYSMTP